MPSHLHLADPWDVVVQSATNLTTTLQQPTGVVPGGGGLAGVVGEQPGGGATPAGPPTSGPADGSAGGIPGECSLFAWPQLAFYMADVLCHTLH